MWKKYKNCFISSYPQGSDEWKNVRRFSINASEMAGFIGLSPYNTIEESISYALETVKKIFSEYSLKVMKEGNIYEPYIRKWYEKKTGNKVIELGSAVWAICPLFRSSLDGFVIGQNKSIEIKHCQKMPNSLLFYDPKLNIDDPYYHEHIPVTHYCQMQQGMEIFDLDSCEYLVHGADINKIFYCSVLRNRNYWKYTVLEQIMPIVNYMIEYIKTNNLPIDMSFNNYVELKEIS